ncbi:hypothetical protein [Veillonella seminalis]|jgi:hypothetical protein|uniref:hypothetical protein n=1 Tax=Veillonella seminalis TaxID=1502943 RepID=UPI00206C1B01|nr:MAG TPA: hypothetical protein [Caudoviricetes sp.]
MIIDFENQDITEIVRKNEVPHIDVKIENSPNERSTEQAVLLMVAVDRYALLMGISRHEAALKISEQLRLNANEHLDGVGLAEVETIEQKD